MRRGWLFAKRRKGLVLMLGALLLVPSCGGSERSAGFSIPACLRTIQPPDGEPRNVWASVAPSITERYLAATATGCDGKIYLVGGLVPSADFDESGLADQTGALEIYDPSQNTWSPAPAMPTPRSELGAVTGRDGRIYAIGGGIGDQFTPSDAVEVYSPDSNTWEAAAPLPTAMDEVNATVDRNGNMYAINEDTMAIYNAKDGAWSLGPPMPTPRDRMAVAAGSDGKIYAIGGFGGKGEGHGPVDAVEAYSPSTGGWEKRKRLPISLGETAGVVAFDGKIYVFGGQTGTNWDWSSAAYAYTPEKDSWEKIPSMPVDRHEHSAAIGPDGRMYVIDGDAAGDVTNRVDVFTPGG